MNKIIKIISKMLMIATIVLSISSTIVQVQVQAQTDKPVDLSNSIFKSCGLDFVFINGARNELFIVNCTGEVLRFIIIMSVLLSILKIALDGIAKMDPTSSNKLNNKTIQNVVMGLFLISAGWMLLPILNASANNASFMSLPKITYTSQEKNKEKSYMIEPVKTYQCESITEILGKKICIIKE